MKKKFKNNKIVIFGSDGMIGRNLVLNLKKKGYRKLLTPKKKSLDLLVEKKVENYLKKNKPKVVINLAAKNAGSFDIKNNQFEYLFYNTKLINNLVNSSNNQNIPIFINISSASAYSNNSKKNKEEDILNGKLDKETASYGLSKIIGIKLIEYLNKKNYFSLIFPNIFGPKPLKNKNYQFIDLFVREFLTKKNLKIKVNKKIKREFLYLEDASDAIIFFLEKSMKNQVKHPTINIKPIVNISLIDILKKISQKTKNNSYKIYHNKNIPFSLKMLDTTIIKKYNWNPKIKFNQGLFLTVKYFKKKLLNK